MPAEVSITAPRHKPSRRLWPLLLLGPVLAFWVLNASTPGHQVDGCAESCSTTEAPSDGLLRVLSFNMLHGFPLFKNLALRLELIAREIVRLDADIVLLQEVPWTPTVGNGAQALAQSTGMNYVFLRANGNRWAILFEDGEAILSRYPLRDTSFTELQPSAGPFQHRVALGAVAQSPWGALQLFVTHLTDGDQEINRQQLESLKAFVGTNQATLTIVAGDFNATEQTPQIQGLAGQWQDTYRLSNPEDAGLTCCVDDLTADPAEPLEERIDYLFTLPGSEGGVELVGVQRVFDQPFWQDDAWQWASDHLGLMATFRFPAPGCPCSEY